MKKTHIILLITLAVAIGVIISTISDSSTYASFSEAMNNPGKEYHVVGVLNRDKDMEYDPQKNANLFSFYMLDNEGKELKVLFNGTKPQDFERSEQIVITGKYNNDAFYADKILMKCPSKYNDPNNNGFTEVKANS
jgi:cytochrome c-type biogenesis protein CcmE